jgi:hypothetical protein
MSVMRDSARGAQQATKIKDRIAGYQANSSYAREVILQRVASRVHDGRVAILAL